MSNLTFTPADAKNRWSAEERHETYRRQRVVRWLHDEALIPLRTIQAVSPTHNATQDYQASGAPGTPWLTGADWQSIGRLTAGPRPVLDLPRMSEVRPIQPPPFPKEIAVAWLSANGTESVRSIEQYLGERLTRRRVVPLAARGRGFPKWSMSFLDSIYPDMTGPRLAPWGTSSRHRSEVVQPGSGRRALVARIRGAS